MSDSVKDDQFLRSILFFTDALQYLASRDLEWNIYFPQLSATLIYKETPIESRNE